MTETRFVFEMFASVRVLETLSRSNGSTYVVVISRAPPTWPPIIIIINSILKTPRSTYSRGGSADRKIRTDVFFPPTGLD